MDPFKALEDVCVTNELLEKLRQVFQGDVRSVRRLERMTSVRDLLQILERQDLLNENSIQTVCRIVAPHEVGDVQPQHLPAGISTEMNKIHELIARKIGRHWKEFARQLGVNENEIDAYDFDRNLRKDPRRITLQILIKFRQDRLFHNPQDWLSQIRRALHSAKRNDIYEEVEDRLIRIGGYKLLGW